MKRILVIDDNIDFSSYLRKLLTSNSYKVTVINDSRQALVEAVHSSYDLILLDINMPEMDGFSFLKEYNSRFLKLSPIWILTAFRSYENSKRTYNLGACNFFPKETPGKTIVKLINIFLNYKDKGET